MSTALNIKKLSKVYTDGFKALDRVSFDVQEGDFFSLLGPNGAGKTSLINILTQLNRIDEGHIEVFGLDLRKEPVNIKRMIGLVPQEFNFNMFLTVQQILFYSAGYYGLSPKAQAPRINMILKKLNLFEKRYVMARFLSGGMKRRLMIARALIHQPKILLLDEPTAGVDVETRQETWAFLKQLNQEGLTIILTTHYLEEAERLCNQAAVLHLGQLRFSGSMNALLKTFNEEYIQFFFSQPITKLDLPKYFKWLNESSACVTVTQRRTLQKVFSECEKRSINVDRIDVLESRLERTLTGLSKGKKL